jgi:hypothetical protein
VKTTGNAGTLQGLVDGVLAADGHETRHLNLGELNLAAAKGSQRLGVMLICCIGLIVRKGLRPRTMSATLNF